MQPRSWMVRIGMGAVLAGCLAWTGAAKAEEEALPAEVAELGDVEGLAWEDPVPELWFPVGEVIDYTIQWGVFKVAEAAASTTWSNRNGRRLVVITIEGESNGIVEKLYPVKIYLQTILDPATFLPLSYEKRNSEGKRRSHEITVFDHAEGKAHWRSLLKDKAKELEIEANTRDLLGLMYWIRGEPVHAKETREYHVMADDKLYELVLEAGRGDRVKMKRYGRVPCIKMEPKGKFEGMFIRKGRLFLCVSDDPRYVITRATASVPVASIKIMLRRVRGPGNDFWVDGQGDDDDDEDDDDDLLDDDELD